LTLVYCSPEDLPIHSYLELRFIDRISGQSLCFSLAVFP